MGRRPTKASALVFVLVTAAFLRPLGGFFVADDLTLLHGITNPDGHSNWRLALEHWYHSQHFSTFRPLMTLWQLSLLHFFGPNPFAFHLASALLHGAVAVTAFRFFRLAFGEGQARPDPAFWAALLFAVYPLQFETVAYLGAASGQFSALFVLGALSAVLRWRREHDWRWLLTGLAAGALALASKEDAIMLPLVVMAVTWLDAPRWRTWNAARDAAIAAAVFAVLLGLYAVHRYLALGAVVPPSAPLDTDILRVIRNAIGVAAARFAAPINADAYADAVPTVGFVTLTLALVALALARDAVRMRWRRIVFSLGLAVGCCASVFQVMPLVAPELANARYLYLPMLGIASAFACAATPLPRHGIRGMPIALVVFALWCACLLQANLEPWVRAGRTMAQVRTEALALTGSDIRVPVANIPDNIDGAFFDRGGWLYARLEPFTPSQTFFRRTRELQVANFSLTPVVLRTVAAGTHALTSRLPSGGVVGPGTTTLVKIGFEPLQAGPQTMRMIAESAGCGPQVIAEIRGRGESGPVRQTYLLADASGPQPDLDPSDGRMNLQMVVTDTKDGVAVYGVAFDPPASSGWRTDVYRLIGNQWVPLARAPDLLDGGTAVYSIYLSGPPGPAPLPTMVPTVRALNAPPAAVVGAENIKPAHAANGFPRLELDQQRPPEARGRPGPARAEIGLRCAVTKVDIDFGLVEAGSKRQWTTNEMLMTPSGKSPPWLFWDDQRGQARPLADVYDATPIFRAGPHELETWSHRASVEVRQVAADAVAVHSKSEPLRLTRSELDIDPRSAAFAVIRMRAQGGGSFGTLSWRTDTGLAGAHGFGVIPDGMWRIAVAPLHRATAWKRATRVIELSLVPLLSGGYVEISDVRLIGRLKDVVPAGAETGASSGRPE